MTRSPVVVSRTVQADPVHVQSRSGGGGGPGGPDEDLVGREQGVYLLVEAGQAAGAQDAPVEHGRLDVDV